METQSKGEEEQERKEGKGGRGDRVSECVSKHERAGASGCRGGGCQLLANMG